jgi:hypothetical protein
MSQDFTPDDFEPVYQQAIILTIAIQENPGSSLSILAPDLISIHTQLSTLIFKASNPDSLLRKRCSDRHGEWLQIQYDLQNTLCEAQDLVDSLSKSEVLEIGHEGLGLEKVEEELSVHAFLIGQFIESLGLSKLARKDPALGEIERILLDAAREERESLGKEKLEEVEDVNRLGGCGRVWELLRKNGVNRSEINRLDTRIKQVLGWVLRNEEEITMIKDLEGFSGMKKEDHVTEPPGKLVGEQGEQAKDESIEMRDEVLQEEHSELYDEEYEQVPRGRPREQTREEDHPPELEQTVRYEDNDTESVESFVWV